MTFSHQFHYRRFLVSAMIGIGLCSCAPPQQSTQPTAPQAQVSTPSKQQAPEPSIAAPTKPNIPVPAKPPRAKSQIIKPVIASKTREARAERPSSYTEPTTGMEFVLIQGGTLDMGDISGKDLTASPAHRVTVPEFYMGIYEVTFDQYDQFCEATNREKPDDAGWGRGNRPVINVNWFDAVAFTEWLSEQSGRTFQLPTEAEWEYAARAGTTTKYWWGNQPGSNNANCKDCGSRWDDKMTAPVGSFSANPWGLYDIIGNVSEWLLDTRHDNYIGAPTDGSEWVKDGNDQFRMDRSGYWHNYVVDLKSWDRSYHRAEAPKTNIGFRLVLEP